jgi:hypothetical protein
MGLDTGAEVLMIILSDGTFFEVDDDYSIFLQQSYPDLDVYRELLAMGAWSDSNPKKRKTRAGIKRFITAWLNKASKEERGISPFAAQIPNNQVRDKIGLRSWASVDCLTHDFMESESFRRHCLQTYGQYVTLNGDRVEA